jgi:hypothetical protein
VRDKEKRENEAGGSCLFQLRFEIGNNTKKLEMMKIKKIATDRKINNRQSNLKYLFRKKNSTRITVVAGILIILELNKITKTFLPFLLSILILKRVSNI